MTLRSQLTAQEHRRGLAQGSPKRTRGRLRFFLYQSGPLATGVTSLLVWPFLGHIISKAMLGELSTALAFSSIIAPALGLGLHLFLANKLAGNESGRTGLAGKIGFAVSSALYTMAVLSSVLAFAVPQAGPGWIIVALSFGSAAFLLTSGMVRGLDAPYVFSAFTLVVQIGGLAVLGVVSGAKRDLAVGVVWYIAIIGLGLIAQYFMVWRTSDHKSWAGGGRLIGNAVRLVPHLVLAVASLMMMRILVGFQSGAESLASYHYASLLIGGTVTVAASLDAHWSVRAQSASSMAAVQSLLERNQLRIQLSLVFATTGVLLFCGLALPLWLPPGYDSRPIALTVILALPAAALQAYADGRAALAMWMNRNGLVSSSTAIGVIVSLGVAVVLIPVLGWPVVGVAITIGALLRAISICWGTWLIARTFTFSWKANILVGIQSLAAVAAWIILTMEL